MTQGTSSSFKTTKGVTKSARGRGKTVEGSRSSTTGEFINVSIKKSGKIQFFRHQNFLFD
jgi:hypothetical protein